MTIRDFLARVQRWLRSLLSALLIEPLPVWLALGGPAAVTWLCVSAPFLNGTFSDRVRWASGVLQLAGALVVVLALIGRHRLLKETPFIARAKNWLSRVTAHFRKSPAGTVILGAVGASIGSGSASARAWLKYPDAERRLDAIETELGTLHTRIDKLDSDVADRIGAAHVALESRHAAVRSELADLGRQVRGLAVGSAHWELMGLVWLLLGLVLASFPSVAGVFGTSAA